MANITLEIVDPAGTRRQKVKVPDELAVGKVGKAIARKMNIPTPENGRFILVSKADNKILDNT